MTQHQVDDLTKKFPSPATAKTIKAVQRLEYMSNFYKKKVEQAPEGQVPMFNGFIWALAFASTQLMLYQELTREIEKLQGGDHENRTDSAE